MVRNNYFIQTNTREVTNAMDKEELGWVESTIGPEDSFEHGSHGLGKGEGKVEGISLRTERQTLRRLRVSGGVVFTVRTYLTGMGALEREEIDRLASAVRSWPEDVGRYKGRERWQEHVDQIAANKY